MTPGSAGFWELQVGNLQSVVKVTLASLMNPRRFLNLALGENLLQGATAPIAPPSPVWIQWWSAPLHIMTQGASLKVKQVQGGCDHLKGSTCIGSIVLGIPEDSCQSP